MNTRAQRVVKATRIAPFGQRELHRRHRIAGVSGSNAKKRGLLPLV
jgi:hypothetical protein